LDDGEWKSRGNAGFCGALPNHKKIHVPMTTDPLPTKSLLTARGGANRIRNFMVDSTSRAFFFAFGRWFQPPVGGV
jgi:hypothetical protein